MRFSGIFCAVGGSTRTIVSLVLHTLLAGYAVASPIELEKRSTQVSLIAYTFTNNVLAGSINVQNIAFTKVVSVYYAVGSSWAANPIAASYSAASTSGYETWTFSGTASGATQFYIQYSVSGTLYYDPGNFVNYQISGGTTTSTSKSSTSTTSSKASTTTSPTSVSTTSTTSSTSTKVTTSSSIITSTTTSTRSSSSSTSTKSTTTVVAGGAVTPSQIPPFFNSPFPSESVPAISGCTNWNGADSCTAFSTGNYNFSDASENRRWQTPPSTGSQYVSTFQSYRDLTGYADIQYNTARTSAVVVINALSRTSSALTYKINRASQSSNLVQVNTANTGGMTIVITSASGASLVLDPIYFLWENAAVSGGQSTFAGGQKGAIVELFGWPYADVAKECGFLSKAGYMGVKVFPPQEHVWGTNYYETDNQFRPWYFLYQPVSYRTHSRMGSRSDLRAMLQTCRAVGVRVYADAVLNHMAGNGNDIQNHLSGGSGTTCTYYSGHNATDGSPYFTAGNTYLVNQYTNDRPAPEFPAVPWGPSDFHCECSLNAWTDGEIMSKCWLSGLVDLNTEKPFVQDRLATYLVDLLSLGFSGFRFDAAKHIGPTSMAQILGRMKNKLGGGTLPDDWIGWHEVILGGESSLLACGGGEWSWYTNYDTQLANVGFSAVDIAKSKIWSSDYPKEMPICGSWVIPASRFVVQNDDHDQQTPGSSSRDMGGAGSVLVKDKDVAKHRGFEVQLFSRTDATWAIKAVLSSYLFMDSGASGFPDGLSDCSLYTGAQPTSACLGVPLDPAYVATACGYTMAQGKYTRVHRDLSIINAMRAWVGLVSTTASALGISGCT